MPQTTTGKITAAAIARLEPGEILRDAELKGFGVRRRNAAVSYFLQTRINGRLRWFTIGRHGAPWTPATARKEALRLLVEIAGGSDPGDGKRQRRETPNVSEAAAQFLDQHGAKLKASTRTEYARLFRTTLVPAFGKRSIRDISRSDVTRLHAALRQTPRKANFALAVLSKLMSWAEAEGYIAEHANPCRLIEKYPETARQRYLSAEELKRLGEVLQEAEEQGSESPYVIAAIRLLLLTGARLSEILTLEWRYVDLARGLLFLPDSKTGQRPVFLNSGAIELLQHLPRQPGNPYVIAGATQGRHLVNLQKPWRRIRARAGIEDVRLHDLRHSFASIAAESGASLPLIGKLLGHTQMQTTQRYAHLVADPVKELSETVGAVLATSLGRTDQTDNASE